MRISIVDGGSERTVACVCEYTCFFCVCVCVFECFGVFYADIQRVFAELQLSEHSTKIDKIHTKKLSVVHTDTGT